MSISALSRLKDLLYEVNEAVLTVRLQDQEEAIGRDASVEDLGQSNLSLEDLTALSNIVERVAKSLDDSSDAYYSFREKENEEVDGMDSGVVVYGPPGMECHTPPRLSKGRFDAMKSVVYSRVSTSVGLSSGHTPSHAQILSIPPKDTPRVMEEVYATPANGQRPVKRSLRCVFSWSPDPSSGSSIAPYDPSSGSSIAPSPISSESSYGDPTINPSRGSHLRRSKRIRGANARSSTPEGMEGRESGLSISRDPSPSLLEASLPTEIAREVTPVSCGDSQSRGGSHDRSCDTHNGMPTTESLGTASDVPLSPVISEDENHNEADNEADNKEPLTPDHLANADHLSISAEEDEFFSAQEDSGEENARSPKEKKGRSSYTADTGGSICCDGGEDMIAGTVTLTTAADDPEEEEDDGYFIGQASPSDSDIQQMRSSDQKLADGAISSSGVLSSLYVSENVADSEVMLEPEDASIPNTTMPDAALWPVLRKSLQVVVPKLQHRNLGRELKKLKSSLGGSATPSPQKKGHRRKSPAKRLLRSQQGTVVEVNRHRVKHEDMDLSGGEEVSSLVDACTDGRGHKTRQKRKNHTMKEEFESEEFLQDNSDDSLQDSNALQDSGTLQDTYGETLQDGNIAAVHESDAAVVQDSNDATPRNSDTVQDSDGEGARFGDEALQDGAGEGRLQDKGEHGDSDSSECTPTTPTSKYLSLSSDDITFSDLDNLNSPAPAQSSSGKHSRQSSSSRKRSTSSSSTRSTKVTPRQSSRWGSDDDDFDMTLSQPPSSQNHAHSSRRNKKKKTLRKVSSDEDEKPFPSSSKGKKGTRQKFRLKDFVKEEKLDDEMTEGGEKEVKAVRSKKRLEFGRGLDEKAGDMGDMDATSQEGEDATNCGDDVSVGEQSNDVIALSEAGNDSEGDVTAKAGDLDDVTEEGGAYDDVTENGRAVTEEGGASDGVVEEDGASMRDNVTEEGVDHNDVIETEGNGGDENSNVKHEKDTASETTPTLKVNILLSEKSLAKLGKHAKGLHGKGKEKAPCRPDMIMCCACGQQVNWRNQKIHAHPRLNVVICQYCHRVWSTGEFAKVDMNEIYCSLCGDGGDIVCCDYCDKSFCQACIARISGKKHLRHLLESEGSEFLCYMCDSSPLSEMQELCVEVTGYFGRGLGGKVGPRVKGRNRGQELKSCATNDVDVEGGGGLVDGDSGSERDQGSQGEHYQETKEDTTVSASSKNKRRTRKKSSGLDGFSDDSSSHGEGKSPEVNTDEVDSSDSIDPAKKKGKKRKCIRKKSAAIVCSSHSSGTDNGVKEEEKEEGGGKKLRKRRKRLGYLRRFDLPLSEDENSDEEVKSKKPSRKEQSGSGEERGLKRSLSSQSNSSSGGDEKSGKIRRKKRRLAIDLSSDSDDEMSLARTLRVQLGSDAESVVEQDIGDPTTPTKGAVKYRIADALDSDSSADSGPTVSRKPPKKPPTKRSRKNSGSNSGSGFGGGGGRTRQRVTRSSKAAKTAVRIELSSDDDDFVGESFSQKGFRKRRKQLNRAFLSSDSDSGKGAGSDDDVTVTKVEDGGEEEEEGDMVGSQETSGKKRKKIRKVLSEAKLASETKLAKQEEKERAERLKKRKSMGGNEEESRMILESDSSTKEVIVEVRKCLVPQLKPHQRDGIKFLYDHCVESVQRLSSGKGTGVILAHCMGLGKTLQVIAFFDALLRCEESGVKKVLVLCPVNTVNNWKIEFYKWISFMDCDYMAYVMNENSVNARLKKLRRWFDHGGVIFMGYEMFRNLAISKRVKRKKVREDFQRFLLDPGADLVVCDEGHVMRNSKSTLSIIINQVKTRLRVVLTGTPLQNNLLEYYTMVNFVKPNLLGQPREFTNQFVNPITHGQHRDSSAFDIRTMRQRAHVLHTVLKDTVQRRDFRVLAKALPPKQEYVLKVRLSGVQDKLYVRYLKNKEIKCYVATDLFSTYAALAKVWNHPWVLRMDEQRKLERAEREAANGFDDEEEDEEDDLDGFIVYGSEDESMDSRSTGSSKKAGGSKKAGSGKKTRSGLTWRRDSNSSTSCPQSRASTPASVPSNAHPSGPSTSPIVISSGDDDDNVYLPPITVKSEQKLADGRNGGQNGAGTAQNGMEKSPDLPSINKPIRPWYDDLVGDSCEDQLDLSGKLVFLFELLEQTKQLKEKVLVFSQSLLTLDIIEEFLSKPQFGDWVPALDYYRLDGSTQRDIRTANMSEFNKTGNDRLRLFLISTRAGSLGVNLVAANRVVIFDACWNPSHDLQAIFRAYRYGQEKPVFVYRLLAKGTMEEKIYDRQVTKQSLSMRVVDEKQIGRHFSQSDLRELFMYSPDPPPPETPPETPYSKPEEDLVLCRILGKLQPSWVSSFHEHDSLLEHIDEEELSEEERKAAWTSYNHQMSMESARYNLQTLQDRLDTPNPSSLPSILQPALLHGATPTSVGGVDAALSHARNTSAIYESFREHTRQTRDHIRALNLGNIRVNALKQKFSGSALIPRSVHNEITMLEHSLKLDTNILHDKIQQLNAGLAQFLQSPHSANKALLSVIQKDRQTLQNELEQLKQILTSSSQQRASTGSGNPTSQPGPGPVRVSDLGAMPHQRPINWTTGGVPMSVNMQPPPSSASHLIQATPQHFPHGNVLVNEVSSTTGDTQRGLPFYR